MIDINAIRLDTPGCNHCIHLNNAGAALMPTPVIEAIQEYIAFEAITGGYEAEAARLSDIKGFYVECAKMLNCNPGNIAFTSNATESFARALTSIPFKRGDVILTSTNDYISNQIQFISLKNRYGVQLIHVPDLPEGGIDPKALEEYVIKFSPKLVSISHVPTNSGLIQDVESVGAICEKHDVIYLVDACQSAGQMPLDVADIKCDFLSVTMRKFLRGPRGAGFLYVSDRVLEIGLEPLMIDMRGAQWTGADSYLPRESAKRFEDWEASYALMAGSKAAIEYASRIGLENIRNRSFKLARYTRERLMEVDGIRVLDDGAHLCAITSSYMDHVDPDILHAYLERRGINTSISLREYNIIDFGKRKNVPWSVRIAPHYYNTTEEIDACIDALLTMRQ